MEMTKTKLLLLDMERIWTTLHIGSYICCNVQILQNLSLDDNKLLSVPSDAFSTQTKLKYLSLTNNQLEWIWCLWTLEN